MNKLVDKYYETFEGIEPPYASPLDDPSTALCDLDQRMTLLEEQLINCKAMLRTQTDINTGMIGQIAALSERLAKLEKPAIIRPDRFN
jgi:hypothetical protein